MSEQQDMDRRAALNRSLAVLTTGAARLAAPHWKKPLIVSALLPAHAQATTVLPGSSSNFTLLAATSELKAPSGGGPSGPTVDALNSLTLTSCVNVPGLSLTCR